MAAEFQLDVANDFYSYSSSREDLAMLFEEVMMYYSYGLDRDVAVTDLPANLEFCSQLRVAWGQRNRVAQSNILPRATLILEAVLPEFAAAVTLQLDDVVPTQMRVDEDFCANILVSPSATRSLMLPGAVNTQMPPLFQTYL